jgi:hypothetical protein
MLRLRTRIADATQVRQDQRPVQRHLGHRLLRPVLVSALLIATLLPPALADHWTVRNQLDAVAQRYAQNWPAYLTPNFRPKWSYDALDCHTSNQ